uniref:LysR family transcriptional regulator n=1 Tax=Orrella sp. TaxID=1921583 RepID=UPI004047C57F
MDKLWAMQVFIRVVECGSFSRAAEFLNLANATVTASIRNLEHHLGVTLIKRNTRQLRLTDEGELFLPHCKDTIASVEEIEKKIKGQANAVSGLLRVEAPFALGQNLICPLLPLLCKRHPNLSIALNLTNDPRNLIERGTDVAIRMDSVEDADLVARPIYKAKYIVCGEPQRVDLLQGTHPQNLNPSHCLGLFKDNYQIPNNWLFSKDGIDTLIKPSGPLAYNNTASLLEAAKQGLGLIYILDIFAANDIEKGLLKSVFDQWDTSVRVFHAVTVKSRFTSLNSRAFIDFLIEIFDEEHRPNFQDTIEIDSRR